MKGKRGQFYLLAAIVIIALVIGLLAVTNFSKKSDEDRVEKLAKELDTESQRIFELGAASGNYPWEDFTKNFSDYAGKDVEVIYAIGNETGQEIYYYDAAGAKSTEGLTNYWDFSSKIYTITYEGSNYTFKFRKGQNFYYIITQDINGERYIATNSEE